MPSYRHFWSSDSLLQIDFVANAMSRVRYDWILSNLHLNDNNKAPNRDDINFDKLYKVRPFITSLCNQFMKNYNPTEHQFIDESMIKFKGRSSLKQHMSLKPTKRGYKMWIRAYTNGYVSQFAIYTGKKKSQPEIVFGERVVKDFCKTIQEKSFKIYADNYFSSLNLAKNLLDNGIGYCETTV